MNSRRYSMETRAQKAEATRQRIRGAARDLFVARSSGFTLGDVAAAAGTSVQTVLRAFGSKEALIAAAMGGSIREESYRPGQPTASPEQAVSLLFEDYEEIGDRVIRMLAAEDEVPAVAELVAGGRARHRSWTENAFETQLRQLSGAERERVLTALTVAMDVYVWKVLRRDLHLERPVAEAVVLCLVRGALGI
jgi:AcrR family transcriptional regulator